MRRHDPAGRILHRQNHGRAQRLASTDEPVGRGSIWHGGAVSIPRYIVAAGLVLSSQEGRILMVQTFNRLGAGLILPGGLVEAGESPALTTSREVAEELGLQVTAERLLAVEHRAEAAGRPPSMQFVFAANQLIDERETLNLQPDEIAEAHWVERGQAADRHTLAGQARMRAALVALDSGSPAYLET